MAQWSIGIAVLLCGTVIISDLYARRVPNKALLIALCLGAVVLLLQVLSGKAAASIALAGLALGLAALLPFHLLGWMGAGDVKFFAVIGFLVGPLDLVPIWLLSMVLLTVHGIGVQVWRLSTHWRTGLLAASIADGGQRIWQCTERWNQRLKQAQGARRGMPYAAHLGLSTLLWLGWECWR